MPSASSFTNKVRADTEGRNTKKEYPGTILKQNYLSPLMCSTNINPWYPIQYQVRCKCFPSII